MIEIVDDFFDFKTNQEITRQLKQNTHLQKEFKFTKKSIHDCLSSNAFQDICVTFANNFFSLEKMIGYEIWFNIISTPHNWHTDNDEYSFDTKKILNFPICTIIYYPSIKLNPNQGRLFYKEDINGKEIKYVEPVSNRLILLSPGTPHMVEPYRGERISIVINPWDYEVESRYN